MSSIQRHKPHPQQYARHWPGIAVTLLSATTLPLVSGCDSTNSLTGPRQNQATTPNLAGLPGHYVGHWTFMAYDTALTCFMGCWHDTIAYSRCEQVVTDLTMVGDQSFVGTFRIDSTGVGPDGSGGCDTLWYTRWLKPDLRGAIGGGRVDTAFGSYLASPAPGKTYASIRFTFGQGNRQDLERLIGCTWRDASSAWEVRGGWGESGMILMEKPQSKSSIDARVVAPQNRDLILFECQGKPMWVRVDLHGEQ